MTNHYQIAEVWEMLDDTPKNAAKMRIRSELLMTLSDIVHTNNMKADEAAELFGVTTAVIHNLNRGKINLFSLESLVDMAATAGMTPSIMVAQPKLLRPRQLPPDSHQNFMQNSASAAPAANPQNISTAKFPSIFQETRTHVSTEHAAWLLGRACQTLRVWACYESKGPMRPVRVAGRLAWPVAEIKRVLKLT